MGKNNSIINPNMYIDEYDVEARHAATIGKFNQDNIFYLMTKGLTKEDANNILIEGFLGGKNE
jgi:Fe-S cluster assembly protein SufD